MRILAYDIKPPSPLPDGVRMVALDALLEQSDVVTLHCPLTDTNHHLVSDEFLGRMKPSAFLVNTSRGALVDEQALAAALDDGRLAGAGLDVLEQEPPKPDCPLLTARNCYITPHIAWATKAARKRLLDTAVDNVRAFLEGRPQNVVNGVP
jgi:glycerate dehydrogenase